MEQIIKFITDVKNQIILGWNDMTITYRYILITCIVSIIVGKCLKWKVDQLKNKRNKTTEELKKYEIYNNIYLTVGAIIIITSLLILLFPVLGIAFIN